MNRISLILALILIASCLGCALPGIAFAASETIYSDVLEDLGKDETFDAAQYPEKDEDKMDVIQVAESNAGELFLYVYQPQADKFTASEARISTSIGDNLSPKDYKLTLLSRSGTLSKYRVDELTVLPDAVRYYVIVQLARPWNDDVDGKPSGNEATTVPYPIGKRFTACTIDGNVTYTLEPTQVIPIVSKRVGYIRYTETSGLSSILGVNFGEIVDSHYVAFSTDKPIDKLYEIEITYYTVACRENKIAHIPSGITEDNPVLVPAKFQADNIADVDVHHKHYTWKRIQTKDEFVKSEELTNEAKDELNDKEWVLRFCETEVSKNYDKLGNGSTTYTRIDEVTILRLKFDIEGITYNLGVIDNKQSEKPNQKPDNEGDDLLDRLRTLIERIEAAFKSFGDRFVKAGQWLAANWWVIIVGVVVLAIAVSLFFRVGRKAVGLVLTGIGKALWWFVKYLGIGLFYVITCPYWIIRAIVLAAKKRKQ